MQTQEWISLAFIVLFASYGLSNLYIIVFLRKHGNFSLDLVGFLSLYAGDMRNYRKLNQMFLLHSLERGGSPAFARMISVAHLASAFLLLTLLLGLMALTVIFSL